jgi:hypothetical protein
MQRMGMCLGLKPDCVAAYWGVLQPLAFQTHK